MRTQFHTRIVLRLKVRNSSTLSVLSFKCVVSHAEEKERKNYAEKSKWNGSNGNKSTNVVNSKYQPK